MSQSQNQTSWFLRLSRESICCLPPWALSVKSPDSTSVLVLVPILATQGRLNQGERERERKAQVLLIFHNINHPRVPNPKCVHLSSLLPLASYPVLYIDSKSM